MRSNLFKIAQAATLAVAMAFTFSCSDDKDESGDPSGGGSCEPITIGTQTWQKCNLNVEPTAGANDAATNSACYDNDPSNCAKYGRLYDWATAMALPASCYSKSCGGQIKPKHQGICPSGWHIPSNEDWDKLYRYVDGTSGTESPCGSSTAGTKLKSKTDWESYSGVPAGTDEVGFSALPGGYRKSGYFSDVGHEGQWWSSSEGKIDGAYSRSMQYYSEGAGWSNPGKNVLLSVRCLQD